MKKNNEVNIDKLIQSDIKDAIEMQKKKAEENDIRLLQEENEKLNLYIEFYKSIIDKVRIYIKEHSTAIDYKTMKADYNLNMNDLLEILQGKGK